MEKMKLSGRTIYYDGFRNLHLAKAVVDRSIKIRMIILGDDGKFWIVRPVDGERLCKAGYQNAIY